MCQGNREQRSSSFDINQSIVTSSFVIVGKKHKQSEEEIINYQIDDDLEMIEKKSINVPIQLLTREQLYQIGKKNVQYDKITLAVTLLQQRKIPFLTRKAIWMSFIKKINAQQYFNKEPTYKTKQQIEKDVPRSGIDDKMSKNKYAQLLQKILYAYAIYNSEIGYTQGMNVICGFVILLMSIEGNDKSLEDVEVIENDEEIFSMFVHIMDQLQDLFEQGVPGIHTRMNILERMILNRFPELIQHLEQNSLTHLSMCFSQYYFTLLMQKQVKGFARIVLEMFLIFQDAFLHNFIIGTLQYYRYDILRMNDTEKLMHFFREKMFLKYFQELRKMKKENTIITHFQENHYFDQYPYFINIIKPQKNIIKAHQQKPQVEQQQQYNLFAKLQQKFRKITGN